LGSLIRTNGSCGCNATSFISKDYTCVPCSASINAKAKLTPKSCSCLSAALTWLTETEQCGCTDASASVIGTGAAVSCIVCD
jgi:hypothetical protein